MEIIAKEERDGEDLIAMGWGGDSYGKEFQIGVTYIVEINHTKKKILSIVPKVTEREKTANEQYQHITEGSVIGWYNFKGRIGCWYEPMDGPHEINAIMEYFEEHEEYEKAKKLKECYEKLKEYMIEEDIWKDE